MLSEVVEQIDSVFNLGTTVLVNVLHFNYLFVSALAGSFHSIVLLICSTLCSFICACGYALNDLIVFISEVIGGIFMLLTFIAETLDYIKFTVQFSMHCVALWITTVFTTLWRNIISLLQFANFLVGLVFSAIILLLQLFPYVFIQVIAGFTAAITYTISQFRYVVHCVTEVPKHVLDAFLEIPPGAYLGCLMLVISMITIKLVRYVLRTFAFNFQNLLFVNRLQFFVMRGYILSARHASQVIHLLNFRRANSDMGDEASLEVDDEIEGLDVEGDTEAESMMMYIEEMPRRNRFSLNTSSEDSNDDYSKIDLSSLKSRLQKERERLLCIICQDNAKCMMLLPCRHLCMCQNCVSIIMEDRNICPVCRRPIHEVMRVYL